MNRDQLSKRLETVVNYVPEDAVLADIGSDHAYLPCFAILHRNIKTAIAGEVVKGPFESAKREVRQAGLTNQIDVRFGSGLEVINKGEATCITIAGMGGQLISSILTDGLDKLTGKERLVLQPNVGEYNLRKWLVDHQYSIMDESILREDHKTYEVIVAEKRSQCTDYTEMELFFGPHLMRDKSPVFMEKWNSEKKHLVQVLQSLNQAQVSDQVIEKKSEVTTQLNWIEEVIG
ncbi:tRNA (adenine(22)-N(1))-methyltransferase [Mangrovibacillus cuniculi]|uniref:tRNA (Adenine-N(1))-methyltransferase n=1 Tax=Mangrovibacillus cuniculi TaxID=2593652 RepID=A0A7S8CBF2_9BACI|nr:tRNA (adenine(22)-N(1))-methyltransferase TrmK [Mangrovibacillus cuniculi]QPC46907.1 tRNA (adenine-N(1))-methyltransferase [Mangrovibacillus cuniculi]